MTWPIIDDDLARQLYDEGAPDTEIATAFGVTHNAVYSWRKRNGLPPVIKGRKFVLEGLTKADYDAAMSDGVLMKAAKRLGVHRHTLRRHAEREGWR